LVVGTSFLFYTTLKEIGDELMDCIYLVSGDCRAHPISSGITGTLAFYKPSEEEQKEFCKSSTGFSTCPRLRVYHEYLRASGSVKTS